MAHYLCYFITFIPFIHHLSLIVFLYNLFFKKLKFCVYVLKPNLPNWPTFFLNHIRLLHIVIKILLFVYLSHPHLATYLFTYLPNPILYLPLNLPFHYLPYLDPCYFLKSKYSNIINVACNMKIGLQDVAK